jgi:hypothetical protein
VRLDDGAVLQLPVVADQFDLAELIGGEQELASAPALRVGLGRSM